METRLSSSFAHILGQYPHNRIHTFYTDANTSQNILMGGFGGRFARQTDKKAIYQGLCRCHRLFTRKLAAMILDKNHINILETFVSLFHEELV